MMPLLDRVLPLWIDPLDERADPVADFRTCYADPVTVNGEPAGTADLVARVRALQRAFTDRSTEIVHRVETPQRLVLGFVMHVVHTGPLVTPLGTVEATGRRLAVRATDILTVREDRIVDIWVISDEVGLLRQLGLIN
jgi:predicted ester cyclase